MTFVQENRLKGNYGASYVSSILSSECLVRPVAGDTDVGVDLYCETVVEGQPFLHFWVQVKAGDQCRKYKRSSAASCSFSLSHLEYWNRQPVPVFAALVPVDWPVVNDPEIYIIDITSMLLEGIQTKSKSVTLKSDYVWRPQNRDNVKNFLANVVPFTSARLQCRNGVISPIQTPRPDYEIGSPDIPVSRFKTLIQNQIRRTAALSILLLFQQQQFNSESDNFRHIMASVVDQFVNDGHWENYMARALSYHADAEYSLNAVSLGVNFLCFCCNFKKLCYM